MDQHYLEKLSSSFLDELLSMQKLAIAGSAGRFLLSGFKGLGKTVTRAVPESLKGGQRLAHRIGGQGAVRAGGVLPHMSKIYQAGGVGGLLRSRYGQMGAAAAVPVAAYSALK